MYIIFLVLLTSELKTEMLSESHSLTLLFLPDSGLLLGCLLAPPIGAITLQCPKKRKDIRNAANHLKYPTQICLGPKIEISYFLIFPLYFQNFLCIYCEKSDIQRKHFPVGPRGEPYVFGNGRARRMG